MTLTMNYLLQGHRLTSSSPTGGRVGGGGGGNSGSIGGGGYAGQTADRSVLAAAAERRAQQEANRGRKGEVRLPKSRDDMPDLPSSQEGLRWQVN